jgi:dipeptidyl aminopeptidase/acylaminoacyl peptidase
LWDFQRDRERRLPRLPRGVISGLHWHTRRPEFAISLSHARQPATVYSVDARLGTLTRWTAVPPNSRATSRFSEPQLITIAARDGIPLRGLLYRPNSRRFPGPRPLLMQLHGGPETQARPVFLGRWNYLLEEQGIALLCPNPRGSTGYGRTFLSLDDGLSRENAVADIGDFLNWAARQPDLDPNRIAVYGASYGGFLALSSLIHHRDRLRCGISVAGIANFASFLEGTSEYRRDLRRAEYGDERDPAMAEFLNRISPLTQVTAIRAPVLIAQGARDPRVPNRESEQFVQALRRQGTPVEYLVAPDEGHSFQKAANAADLFTTLAQFLQTHLLE